MLDTRFVSRVDVTLRVVSKINRDANQSFELADGNFFKARAFNIGAQGIGIITKYFLPKGLVVDLEIAGPLFGFKECLTLKGEVRYCNNIYNERNKYKCGISFIGISDECKEAILQFCLHSRGKKNPVKKPPVTPAQKKAG